MAMGKRAGAGSAEGRGGGGGSRPDASVVLCVYNAERRIGKVLDAMLDQDYPGTKWELVIVDDHSKDSTAAVAKEKARGRRNIRVIQNNPNKGLACSRNIGVAASRGEFIFFTDDDCFVPRDWISKGVDAFRNEPEDVGAIAGDVRIPHDTYIADCISYMGYPAGGNLGFRRMFLVDENNFSNSLTGGNNIMRRSVLDRLDGPFDERLKQTNDKDVGIRMRKLGYRIRYHPELTITHMALPSVRRYIRSMSGKGKYAHIITRKHPEERGVYAKLRMRGILNFLTVPPKRYLPGIIPLAALGYGLMAYGYVRQWLKDRESKDARHHV